MYDYVYVYIYIHSLQQNIRAAGGIPTPVKNRTSSVGIMKFPTERKNKTCSEPPMSLINCL